MANGSGSQTSSYFGAGFVAPGLPAFTRTITGHHEDGLAHFLVRDNGDHQAIRKAKGFEYEAAQTVVYSTFNVPVDLNKDNDLEAARNEWKGGHHAKNGTYATILDFSPGAETPMHRGESIDYNVVLEGEFDLVLDSGEVTRMKRGDVNVQRATIHKWVNVSGNRQSPGRLFNVLVDIEPLTVNGKEVKGYSEGHSGPYGGGVGRGHENVPKSKD